MTMTGQLQAIWVKRMKRGPMDAVDSVQLLTGRGIVGNANQGGRRQVTIIEQEVWKPIDGRAGCVSSPTDAAS